VCNANYLDVFYSNYTEPRNEEELIAASQKKEEFILDTWFKEYHQDTAVVWESVITNFGRCWTFQPNSTVLQETDDQIYRPGIYGGLDVSFDLEQVYYDPDTEAAGLRVFVTQRGAKISDQVEAVFVPPGSLTYVGVEKTTFQREKEAPWSHCDGNAPEYTQANCRAQCIHAAVEGACGCRYMGDDMASTDLDLCIYEDWVECPQLSDEEIFGGCGAIKDGAECPDYLRQMHEDGVCDCSRPPCTEEVYKMTSSGMDISDARIAALEEEYGWREDYFGNNFVYLRVNFDMIRQEVLTESKAQTFSQLLGSLGGTMGLFAGISFLSLVEIFGDLTILRLIPRLCGHRQLYGLGTKLEKQRLEL